MGNRSPTAASSPGGPGKLKGKNNPTSSSSSSVKIVEYDVHKTLLESLNFEPRRARDRFCFFHADTDGDSLLSSSELYQALLGAGVLLTASDWRRMDESGQLSALASSSTTGP